MKQIRTGIFETNSSSSHVISIIRDKLPKADIPYNEHIILESIVFLDESAESEEVIYRTQQGKLSFVINLLIIYIVENESESFIKTYEDFTKTYYYSWLEEVVYEISRSTFEINRESINPVFPFLNYMKFNSVNSTVLRLFRDIREKDEEDFKMIVKTIIFDDEAAIIEKAYFDGYNFIVWDK